ncbi:Protein of unknown function [Gryllus bimaculatus]|nr:Protein of unknown function [Gryllus bimaculatus]
MTNKENQFKVLSFVLLLLFVISGRGAGEEALAAGGGGGGAAAWAKVSVRRAREGRQREEKVSGRPETCNSQEASPPSGAGAGGGGGGGATPGAAPRATPSARDPAAPPALERVLEQLGILPHSFTHKTSISIPFAWALALLPDQKPHTRLNYLCKEAESVELLGAARDQIHFVLRAAKYVAGTAETMGALRLEARMSGWMEASLTYADSLRQQLETVRSEHEELRRVLSESGASIDSNSSQGSTRRPILSSKLQLSSPRRASIAVPSRPATSVSPGTGIKEQGRLSLAFIPGSNSQSPVVLRSARRPLSSTSSDTSVGVSSVDGSAPSPPIVPEDFQPLMEDTVQTPLEEDAVDHGSSDEPIPHRNSHPRLSNVDLPETEDALSAPHLRRRESAAPPSVTTMCPPSITPVQTARSLYRTTAAELFDYIWPPDFFVLAQHARWLLVRILILAAVWCVVQAFIAPADAQMQYSSSLSLQEVHEADFLQL